MKTEKAPVGSEEKPICNTKRVSQAKKWSWTLFYDNDQIIEDLQKTFRKLGSKWIFGAETCPSTKKKHLQGYVEFGKKIRPLENADLKGYKFHWEPARSDSIINSKYCSKDGIVYYYGIPPVYPVEDKLLNPDLFFDWQKELSKIPDSRPDPRAIYWIWEPNGGVGKSSFVDWLIHAKGAVVLSGKNNDVLFCAANHESSFYVYDVPRCNENHVSYQSLEQIKNGTYMSAKYESAPIQRYYPHLIIFANTPPDRGAMSADRWRIGEIINKKIKWEVTEKPLDLKYKKYYDVEYDPFSI